MVNVLPQAHVTVASTYSGWIPAFMGSPGRSSPHCPSLLLSSPDWAGRFSGYPILYHIIRDFTSNLRTRSVGPKVKAGIRLQGFNPVAAEVKGGWRRRAGICQDQRLISSAPANECAIGGDRASANSPEAESLRSRWIWRHAYS